MKEQIINFETAKLAKERGLCYYFNTGTQYVNAFYSTDGVVFEETEFQQKDCVIEDRYFRPTQSLLQKWLRETHDIEVYVRGAYNNFDKIKKYVAFVENCGCVEDYTESYEDALEIGLQEALKLI